MNGQEALEIFKRTGALLDGHFVLASGRHSSQYMNKDAAYSFPDQISLLCWGIALAFVDRQIDVVAGPEKGGIILSQWVAHHLIESAGQKMRAVYAEKDGDGFVFRRGYDKLVAGKRVLLVEDVITTGGSIKKVIQAVRTLNGNPIGLGALCNRGGVDAEALGIHDFHALANPTFLTWGADDCPLCKQDVPVNTEVGKGREFLARQGR
ncbi:orotate phosphoribosyltransferase [Candidatus Falkowbacteria bacterium]|nr:orotate phosphoribosyltransferase [Candidatus Falkowbacteria bacterium]